jgi:hypothetical protein
MKTQLAEVAMTVLASRRQSQGMRVSHLAESYGIGDGVAGDSVAASFGRDPKSDDTKEATKLRDYIARSRRGRILEEHKSVQACGEMPFGCEGG